MPVRGLTIVIADVSSERFRAALALAAANAALGGSARLFLSGEAVSILRAPVSGWEDESYADAGLPTLPELIEEAFGLGVKLIVCQSGMQLTSAAPRDFDTRVEVGGMVSLLQTLGDGRLTIA